MTHSATPELEIGRVYRTGDLVRWSANPPRLAKRLVREGRLVQLSRGMFAVPQPSRFGPVPPTDDEIVRAFLGGSDFVFTGPEHWNALGLGTTMNFATQLVYNTKRSGTFVIGSRRFTFRRVAFPAIPSAEWYVVDLLQNANQAGADAKSLAVAVARAVARGVFSRRQMVLMAEQFGTKGIQSLVRNAVKESDR
jgi:hypothetical protein